MTNGRYPAAFRYPEHPQPSRTEAALHAAVHWLTVSLKALLSHPS